MELWDTVIYRGREFVLRGLDPVSVVDASAQLEDPRTGEVISVPLAELEEPPPVSGQGP